MENKQIVIKDYFNILRDEYGRIYCIQEIGDPKSLIKAIREQNEYIQAKEQECEKIKNWVKGMMFYTDCSNWFERFTTAFEDWKNDLTSKLDQLKAENEKLEQTFAEIKEICNSVENIENINSLYDAKLSGMYLQAKKILQKISECEVENEKL